MLTLEHVFREAQRVRISECRLDCVINHYQRPSQQVTGVYERHMRKIGWEVGGVIGQWNHTDSRSDRYFKVQADAGKQRYPSISDAGFSDAPIKGMCRMPVASSDGNFDQPPDYVNQGEPWPVSPDSDNGGCLNAAFAHVLV